MSSPRCIGAWRPRPPEDPSLAFMKFATDVLLGMGGFGMLTLYRIEYLTEMPGNTHA